MSAATPLPTTSIVVAPPRVAGDTVTFAWDQSPPNPTQRDNTWSLHYPGLDLALFDPRLFLEIFLGLQIRVWGALPGDVRVRLPLPVPADSVRLWRDYHSAHRVDVGPLASVDTYSTWLATPTGLPGSADNAVFYTGGRDSSVVANILAELEGADRLLLVHLSEPTRGGRYREPFRRGGAPHLPAARTAVVRTDYRTSLGQNLRALGPHLELYWLACLPTLLAYGARLATTAHEIDSHRAVVWPDGSETFDFRRSRPEWRAGIAGHFQRTLGVGIQLTNLSWPLSQTLTARLLAQRYPSAPSPASCRPLPDGGWCLNCAKCLRHLLVTLAIDAPDPTFDYARMLATSRKIARALAAIRAMPAAATGNVPWSSAFVEDWEFEEWCHWLAIMQPERTLPDMPAPAASNLAALRAAYGNVATPQYEQWSPRALDALPAHLRAGYQALLASQFPAADEFPPIVLPDGGVMRPGWTRPDTPPPALAEAARFAP
jgi:hypothetical protein